MLTTIRNVRVAGLSACLPRNEVSNRDFNELYSTEELEKTISMIGIEKRRVADQNTCASDLCVEAAKKLLVELNWPTNTIDALVFVSMTPDYRIPATSNILQSRLGLKKEAACFDLTFGCSGYIYGLWLSSLICNSQNFKRVLLLVGDTTTKIINKFDKNVILLFGDAGSATALESVEGSPAIDFDLNTDGSGHQHLIIPAGEIRLPSSPDTLAIKAVENGNFRSDHDLHMNGLEVFNFAIKNAPASIQNILKYNGKDLHQDVDFVVYHQANKMMLDFISNRLNIPAKKTPLTLNKYGNVSAPTIPLTIVSELRNQVSSSKVRTLLSGFGIGLSWGSAYLTLDRIVCPKIVEI